jgi:hypothetical protein
MRSNPSREKAITASLNCIKEMCDAERCSLSERQLEIIKVELRNLYSKGFITSKLQGR